MHLPQPIFFISGSTAEAGTSGSAVGVQVVAVIRLSGASHFYNWIYCWHSSVSPLSWIALIYEGGLGD